MKSRISAALLLFTAVPALLLFAATLLFTVDENPANVLGRGGRAAGAQLQSKGAKNLAVFNALGRRSTLPVVLSNIKRHFSNQDEWSCVAFMYAPIEDIPPDDALYVAINALCPILRLPAVQWGNWLQMLHPTFLRGGYDKIALILDDVLLPSASDGAYRGVDMGGLVRQMDEHGLSSIGPAVHGGDRPAGKPRPRTDHLQNCTVENNNAVYEIFLRMYTLDMWTCFYGMLDYRNSNGWCYDKCLPIMCGGKHAVDFSMEAYHLEGLGTTTSSSSGRITPSVLKGTEADLPPAIWNQASQTEKAAVFTGSVWDTNYQPFELCGHPKGHHPQCAGKLDDSTSKTLQCTTMPS